MNQFETAKNIDAYCELAKAIVLLACDDYRCYNKHFHKNLDIMQYITGRMEEIKQAGEENPDEWKKLQRVKDDIEFDQRKLQSKMTEIEMFLKSNYGMTLSYGLGNTIFNKSETIVKLLQSHGICSENLPEKVHISINFSSDTFPTIPSIL